jgi:hypothetical protein
MTASLVSDEMRAAVGTHLWRLVSYPVSESDIRRWAVAVYYPEEPPRLFWDAGYASGTVHGGIVAPEDFNPFAWMVAESSERDPGLGGGQDFVEQAAGIRGPGLAHSVYGGMEVTYGVRIRPGDVIASVTTLAGYDEREGRHGRMLFTVTESRWTNDRGERVKLFRSTTIRY